MEILHKWKGWNLSRIIFLIAGSITFSGILLGYFMHSCFYLLPLLVGVMQIIFAVTGFCPMAIFLKKCGVKCENKK